MGPQQYLLDSVPMTLSVRETEKTAVTALAHHGLKPESGELYKKSMEKEYIGL